ncbi:MAG: acyl-CoA synthetase [Proteobacteria bacterium]|nr:acyl-CoA synthetase [Pseudomonadota bacterium]
MSDKKPVSGVDNVRALETKPWDEVAPARSTYELLAAAAARWPDKTAITFLPTGALDEEPVRITFRQMMGRIHQAANLFNALGAGPQDAIAFLLPLLPQAQFTLWGAEAAGIANPINFLLSPDQIADLLNAAEAKVVVALGPNPNLDVWPKVESILGRVPSLKAVVQVGGFGDEANGVYSFDKTIDQYSADGLTSGREFSSSDIASYFHTGGTTGSPKLAQHTHGNEVWAAWALAKMWNVVHDDVFLCGLPLFHVAGAFYASLTPLSQGAEIVIPSPAGMRNPIVIQNTWRLTERYGITQVGGVPTTIVSLNQVPVKDTDVSSMKYGVTGGAALPVQVEKDFTNQMGVRLLKIYGATEATVVITASPPGSEQRYGSVGIRMPYVDVAVVRLGTEGTTNESCDSGRVGAVMLKGPNVFPGYKDESQNEGTLTEDGWLITGDLGHLDEDGFLFLTGRSKDLIIRSGHNIDPGIIEEVLNRHPAVSLAAAVGKPDEYAGELPVAYVQLVPDATTTAEELHDYVSQNVSERPALPKEVIIIDAIPMTAVGKIFKPQLKWDQARKHFTGILYWLKDDGLELSVEVGESKTHGTLCRVTLSGNPSRPRALVEDEITACLNKYPYIKSEVVWQ